MPQLLWGDDRVSFRLYSGKPWMFFRSLSRRSVTGPTAGDVGDALGHFRSHPLSEWPNNLGHCPVYPSTYPRTLCKMQGFAESKMMEKRIICRKILAHMVTSPSKPGAKVKYDINLWCIWDLVYISSHYIELERVHEMGTIVIKELEHLNNQSTWGGFLFFFSLV